MIHYGSCNSQTFAVHQGAISTGAVGTALDQDKPFTVSFARGNTVTDINLFRSTAPGQQWGWQYEAIYIEPSIRLIRSAANAPLYIWEAETPCDPLRSSYTPLIETDETGASIVPDGGSALWMNLPSEDILESLETDVENASQTWTTGTIWDGYSSTYLLQELFRYEQSRCGLRLHNTIGNAMDWLASPEEYDLYKLLWLRCASRILYNHMGHTCIPLILDRFLVDVDGIVGI